MIARLNLFGLALLPALAIGCGDKDVDDTETTDDTEVSDDTGDSEVAVETAALSVTADAEALYKNEVLQVVAEATLTDDSTLDVTGDAEWSSSDEAVASVVGGQVTGLSAGSATITASYDGFDGVVELNVAVLAVSGQVVMAGWPVGDVQVTLAGPDGDEVARTDLQDGGFAFPDLGVGSYTASFRVFGHRFDNQDILVELSDASVQLDPVSVLGADYPDRQDLYEDDDEYTSATPLAVDGALQPRTLWADEDLGNGDQDWFAVELTGGVQYEFFTTNLCESCDTYMYLYDTDGSTLLTSDDDYQYLDSRPLFTPEQDGTYYLQVRAYDDPCGVASYFMGALTFVDADEDDQGAYHDCDDSDPDIATWNTDVGGDGVDQNCDGFDMWDPTVPDGHEPDDTLAEARELGRTIGSIGEHALRGRSASQFSGSIDSATDEDWFTFTLPAYGGAYVYWQYDGNQDALNGEIFEADGETLVYGPSSYSYYSVSNDQATEQTWTVRMSAYDADGHVGGAYTVYLLPVGLDADQDGYSTQDWDSSRDMDDADSAVNGCVSAER